jgi:hypothetical protein
MGSTLGRNGDKIHQRIADKVLQQLPLQKSHEPGIDLLN